MKQKKIVRIIAIVIAVALALSLLMIPFAGMAFAAEPEEDGITVLFTHDLHDCHRTDPVCSDHPGSGLSPESGTQA